MRGTCLLLSLVVAISAYSLNETTKTVKVRGEYAVLQSSSTLQWQQAPELAREEAKRIAIEKVCGTKVNVWDKVEITGRGESFNSLSINQTDGEIVEFDIIEEGTYQSDVRKVETIFFCEAKVIVKRGVAADPNFVADVTGIQSVYYEGDGITFNVKPYQDCYLKVFLFVDATTGYRIYPNNLETPFLLLANKDVLFPTKDYWEYSVTKDTDAPFETNRLVFVFTKEERPFYQETTSREEIEKWMALIPNDKKYFYFAAFDIRKK